jgi:hypothetical protein
MEFHISKAARKRYGVEESLFNYAGNVIFGNLAASRELANRVNTVRKESGDTQNPVHAAALFAMGLIDELSHVMIAQYRQTLDPKVLAEALDWFGKNRKRSDVQKLLLKFTELFPNTPIYRGEQTAEEWLKQTVENFSNREAALEELLLLWLSNLNPAFKPFREFFEDEPLREQTIYSEVTPSFDNYFATRPQFGDAGTLLDVLRAPMLASPDSLGGQLAFIREQWPKYLGEELRRVLLAIDVLKEEDIAIWLQFHPPSASAWHPDMSQQKWQAQGFTGDEFTGWGEGRGSSSQAGVLHEYEAFSPDEDWMPNVVLIAKSTYVWLEQLSKKYGRWIQRLDQIPDEELALLANKGLNGLWLIGLWERSIASQTIKRMREQEDAVASAYSLRDYRIADDLGGEPAYTYLRDRAAAFGIRLASDMVPNHMGIDSGWVIDHPEWFLSRPDSPYPVYSFNGPDLSSDNRVELKIEDHYYDQTDAAVVFRRRDRHSGKTEYVYHGNDGTSFAWNDTAQLDYSKGFVREQVIQTILNVARRFPIIRFDAAMTLAKKHVQRLWFPLPGTGGSIPSRAEFSMTNDEFNALMPNEFWREVVDRVAAEVPGTLLLAEAFWLLEGYFVRTLGMHRVYNSAFMNMLRDEENAKYQSYLKRTIEFDPDILKRYVNFMSNPDERTAIDQFGTGDKYFGTCTMMATLPGLPMFGHGQIEAFTEKYGMEYKRARYDETPNADLIARHQREIAPLLRNRRLFAESSNFVMYDFWTGSGTIDENVFAYSNRRDGQRAIVLFNNRYSTTRGTVHHSAAMMDKGSGTLVHKSLGEALDVPNDRFLILACEDTATGLHYLYRPQNLRENGLTVELRAYQYAVLQHWHALRPSFEQPWDRLCDTLHGKGVYSLDEALTKLRLWPAHDALRQALSPVLVESLIESIEAEDPEKPQEKGTGQPVGDQKNALKLERQLESITERAVTFFQHAMDLTDAGLHSQTKAAFRKQCLETLEGVVRLPKVEEAFIAGWPEIARTMLPSTSPAARAISVWAPVLAWAILRGLSEDGEEALALFEQLHLRSALAEIFSLFGLEGEASWRAAARVRLLLTKTYLESGFLTEPGESPQAFWQDPDVRWLLGVNESGRKSYLNKECLEEMLWWLQLPGLADQAEVASQQAAIVEKHIDALAAAAERSGYELPVFLELLGIGDGEEEPDAGAIDAEVIAEGSEVVLKGKVEEVEEAESTVEVPPTREKKN